MQQAAPIQKQAPQAGIGRSAFLVASGIFLSRVSGVIREVIFGHFFGLSFAADAFRAALRIPNVLQNLFGEGVLSASFIPVYARLVAEGDEEESGRVAGTVFSLLTVIISILVVVGEFATERLIPILTGGFKGEALSLTIHLVRILFPGVGLLVLSAWCLGILNSHRRFFLSYVTTVFWNAAMIVALLLLGWRTDLPRLAVYLCWASLAGWVIQFFAQLPTVLRLIPRLSFSIDPANENVRAVVRNFFPIFISRGVVQLTAYIDQLIATYLPTGSVAALGYAQTLYMLPISLFGMSVSAAELPAMSSETGSHEEIAHALRERIASSTRRIGFFVVPSTVAFLALGDVIAAVIYQGGRFTHEHAIRVWPVLAGSAIGLVASTTGRLYSSAYYALRDTWSPFRFAVLRVSLTAGLGYAVALPLPRYLGIDPVWGAAGLTSSAGVAGWIEFVLLRRGMNRRIGSTAFPYAYFAKLWGAALLGAAGAWAIRMALPPMSPRISGLLILLPYGLVYLGTTALLGINETTAIFKRLARIMR